MGKKKIEGAPTVADAVSSEVIARGIADRDVSRLGHVVIFDAVPAAVPEPQGKQTEQLGSQPALDKGELTAQPGRPGNF